MSGRCSRLPYRPYMDPPFKGSLDYDAVSPDLLKVCKTKKTELLFLALFLRMLKTGGRCACFVLFGSSKAHGAIRKELVEENRLEAKNLAELEEMLEREDIDL